MLTAHFSSFHHNWCVCPRSHWKTLFLHLWIFMLRVQLNLCLNYMQLLFLQSWTHACAGCLMCTTQKLNHKILLRSKQQHKNLSTLTPVSNCIPLIYSYCSVLISNCNPCSGPESVIKNVFFLPMFCLDDIIFVNTMMSFGAYLIPKQRELVFDNWRWSKPPNQSKL